MIQKKAAYSPTWVTEQLAVGAAPMSYAQLDCLRESGVTAILNLCGEFCDLHDIESQAGFEVYHLPLADEEAPDLVALEKALAWLDEAIYLGKKVLIHCRHGIGRTGTLLNAYLLRRGLGHRLAWLKLRNLRSKPTNFAQWWTIRKYGKNSPRLTIREPSLEMQKAVDLSPYFIEYEALIYRVDDLSGYELREQCGREHCLCCRIPIHLTLIESVYLTHRLNIKLRSSQRLEVISRAVERSQLERDASKKVDGTYCLSDIDLVCPLYAQEKCMLFSDRPLQCRTFGIEAMTSSDLWEDVLSPALRRLSFELWLAFIGKMARDDLPRFSLCDVVSGKYVQQLFHFMR